MYIVVDGDSIIAAHDDEDVVQRYVDSQSDPDQYDILKVTKKKKKNQLMDVPDFHDIYLIEYRGSYVPYHHYELLTKLGDHRVDDLEVTKSVLILNLFAIRNDNNPKLEKAYRKVIGHISGLIDDEPLEMDHDTLNRMEREFEKYIR